MLRTQNIIALVAAVCIAAPAPARAQAFAEVKTALVDYSKTNIDPQKACKELGKYKSKDIAQIAAAVMPASAAAPAQCRVTGLLSPEIAFANGTAAGRLFCSARK